MSDRATSGFSDIGLKVFVTQQLFEGALQLGGLHQRFEHARSGVKNRTGGTWWSAYGEAALRFEQQLLDLGYGVDSQGRLIQPGEARPAVEESSSEAVESACLSG